MPRRKTRAESARAIRRIVARATAQIEAIVRRSVQDALEVLVSTWPKASRQASGVRKTIHCSVPGCHQRASHPVAWGNACALHAGLSREQRAASLERLLRRH